MATGAFGRWCRLGALVTVSACGSGDSGPTTPPPPIVDNTPASIVLSPSGTITLQSGIATTVAATVLAKDGHQITSAAVTWSSTDPTVATVAAGAITGVKVGGATISATAGVASASVAVTVTPGAPAALAIRTQPVGATIGSPLSTQAVVEVRDLAGNLVPSATATVTAAIASGGGTLGGTTTVVAAGGVAAFTDLSISGVAGDRTLSFSAPGLASVTSAAFTMSPPPTPLIVVDSASITFTAVVGASPASKAVKITNGGTAAFTSVTINAPVYDAGQVTGWLTASLSGSAAPFTLTLVPAAASLAVGTYHAIVRINAPGATNTPLDVSVTLNVVQPSSLTWGTTTERVRVIDPGTTYSPALTAVLNGQVVSASSVTFTSRAAAIATVDASGRIAGLSVGQTWVAASMQGVSDSVYVIVTRAAGAPVLRADLTDYVVHAGDVFTVNVTLDPRSTAVGAATIVVGYETENSMFVVQSATVPNQTPLPTAFNSSYGVFRANVASANALTGTPIMLRLLLSTPRSGLSGWITLTVLDMADPNANDITLQATSTRYPIIVR